MIKCPSCSHDNFPGTVFCEGCGEELPQGEAATGTAGATSADAGANANTGATQPDNISVGDGDSTGATAGGAAAGSGEVICPACENPNPAGNAFCEVCGTELPGGAATAPDSGATAADSGAATPMTMDWPAAATPDADTAPSTAAAVDDVQTSATPAQAAADADTDNAGADAPAPTTQPIDTDATADDRAGTIQVPASAAPAGGGVAAAPFALQQDSTTGLGTAAVDIPSTAAPSPQTAPTAPAITDTADSGLSDSGLAPGKAKLVVEQGMSVGKQFVLGDAEMQVGREDDEEDIYPDIDLADQDEGYVHRQHATLRFTDGDLTVTHLGGANKTRVNNRPIPDNEPQPLKIGDKVAFGKVVLRVQPL